MYHFACKTLRDGRVLPVAGDLLVHEGQLLLCDAGYHMSECVLDALRYAPGTMLAIVEPGGDMLRGTDKLVARERYYVTGYVDVSAALTQFSRECALRALRIHAPAALRAAGLAEHAAALAALPDDCDLAAAWAAARAAADAAWAAWPAAGAAAGTAARAAWAAVESAAWAAWAACPAGWAAERDWQEARLIELVAPLMEMP